MAKIAFLITWSIVLVGFPSIGFLVAKSKWTPVVWITAFGIGCLGQALWLLGKLTEHRMAALYWAALYQLFIYSLALSVFLRFLKRRPRDVVFNFNDGFFWDRVFGISVVMISVTPISYLIAPP